MAEWLKISDIMDISGIPETTLRRFFSRFSDFFTTKRDGNATVYLSDCLIVLQLIKEAREAGKNTKEIESILRGTVPQTVDMVAENPPHVGDSIQADSRLLHAMLVLVDQRRDIDRLESELSKRDMEIRELEIRLTKEIESVKESVRSTKNESLWEAFKRLWRKS
jgi:DNA-binding transcriptional MerR regulator